MSHTVSIEAGADLDEIWLYVAENSSVERADRFVASLTNRFFMLAQFPYLGRLREDLRNGYRSLIAGNYVIIYRVMGADVMILRVIHGARDIQSFFD